MNGHLVLLSVSFLVCCVYSAPIFYVGDTDDIFPESSEDSLMQSLWGGSAYGKRVGKRGGYDSGIVGSDDSAEDRLLSSILASRFGIEGKRSDPALMLPDDYDNQLLAALWSSPARRGRGKRADFDAAQMLSRPVRLARIIRQFKVPSSFQNMLNYHIY